VKVCYYRLLLFTYSLFYSFRLFSRPYLIVVLWMILFVNQFLLVWVIHFAWLPLPSTLVKYGFKLALLLTLLFLWSYSVLNLPYFSGSKQFYCHGSSRLAPADSHSEICCRNSFTLCLWLVTIDIFNLDFINFILNIWLMFLPSLFLWMKFKFYSGTFNHFI